MLGVLWIIFSDYLLVFFSPGMNAYLRGQTIKGWGYVIVTALLLYVVLRFYTAWQRRSRETLRQNEQNLRVTLDSIGDAVIATDTDGLVTGMNPVAEQLTGWEVDQARGKPATQVFNIVNTKTRQPLDDPVRAALENGRIVSFDDHTTLIASDGSEYQIADSAAPIQDGDGKPSGVVLVFRDVSADYEIRQTLRESEESYRLLAETAPDLICIHDMEGRITYLNQAALAFTGFSRDGMSAKTIYDFVTPSQIDDLKERQQKRLAGYKERNRYQAELTNAQGERVPVDVRSAPIIEDGDVKAVLLIARDVTEREETQQALQESEEEYRDLVENINEVIYTVDADGIITYISPVVEALGGYAPSELIGHPLTDFVYPDDLPGLIESFQKTIRGQLEPYEYRVLTKSGQIRWARSSSRLIREDGQIVGLRGSLIDITKRKQAEKSVEERNRRLQALYLAGWQMSQTLEPEKIFENVHQIMTEILPCDSMIVSSYDQQEEMISCQWGIGPYGPIDVSKLPPLPLNPDGEGTQSKAIITGEAFNFRDYQKHRKTSKKKYYIKPDNEIAKKGEQPEDGRVPQSALVVPLKLENRTLGVIQVLSLDLDAFTQDDLNFLEALSPQIAAAMANARLYQQAQEEIQERQLAEDKLKAYSEQLEERVQARTVQLRRRVDEVEQLNKTMVNLLTDLEETNQRLQQTSQQLAEANRRLAEERIEEQTALLNLSQALLSEHEIEPIAEQIVSAAATALGVDLSALLLLDPSENAYRAVASVGWPDGNQELEYPVSQTPGEAVGHVIQTGEVLRIADLHDDDFSAPEFVRQRGVRARLLAPVLYQGEAIGCLVANHYQLHVWTDDEVRLLTLIANSAAQALEQARLFEAELHRRKLAETMRQVVQVVGASLELDVILKTLLKQLQHVLVYDTASVLVANDQDRWEMVVSRGYDDEALVVQEAKEMTLESPILRQMSENLEPVIIPDVREHDGWIWVPGAEHVRSFMAVPFVARGRLVGVLMVDNVEVGTYDQADLETAQILAQHVAQAIENAVLFEQVRDNQRRLQSLSRQLVQAQENERRVLARELHDQVGQSLTAVKLNLQTLQRLAEDVGMADELSGSVEIADRALQRIRNLSLNLRPTVLDDFGIEAALEWYLEKQAQWFDVDISLRCDLPTERLAPEMETTCFRITQAALTNAARHAQADHVDVNVEVERGKTLVLTIRDDGAGFDVQAAMQRASQGDSLGLLSMQDRAEQLGGRLIIHSQPGEGTEVQVRLPLVGSECLDETA